MSKPYAGLAYWRQHNSDKPQRLDAPDHVGYAQLAILCSQWTRQSHQGPVCGHVWTYWVA